MAEGAGRGVRADVTGTLLDAGENEVLTPFASRLIGTDVGQFRGIPEVMGLCYGPGREGQAGAGVRARARMEAMPNSAPRFAADASPAWSPTSPNAAVTSPSTSRLGRSFAVSCGCG